MNFTYFKENYQLIAIGLSSQTKLKDKQQINFISNFENQANGATVVFLIEKSKETTFEFLSYVNIF